MADASSSESVEAGAERQAEAQRADFWYMALKHTLAILVRDIGVGATESIVREVVGDATCDFTVGSDTNRICLDVAGLHLLADLRQAQQENEVRDDG